MFRILNKTYSRIGILNTFNVLSGTYLLFYSTQTLNAYQRFYKNILL